MFTHYLLVLFLADITSNWTRTIPSTSHPARRTLSIWSLRRASARRTCGRASWEPMAASAMRPRWASTAVGWCAVGVAIGETRSSLWSGAPAHSTGAARWSASCVGPKRSSTRVCKDTARLQPSPVLWSRPLRSLYVLCILSTLSLCY